MYVCMYQYVCQNGAFLLLGAFIIALGGGGKGG